MSNERLSLDYIKNPAERLRYGMMILYNSIYEMYLHHKGDQVPKKRIEAQGPIKEKGLCLVIGFCATQKGQSEKLAFTCGRSVILSGVAPDHENGMVEPRSIVVGPH